MRLTLIMAGLFLWVFSSAQINLDELDYRFESSAAIIAIAEKLKSNEPVEEQEWAAVFATPGYRAYLSFSDSSAKKELVRASLEEVFLDSKSKELDADLKKDIEMDFEGLRLMFVKNLYALSQNLEGAKEFMTETNLSETIADADSVARLFLPSDRNFDTSLRKQVYFIVSDPDGMVTDSDIVMDLNAALGMSRVELVKFLAHEFHHDYRNQITDTPTTPLRVEINKLHQEGLADLIDKEVPPVKKMGLLPKELVNRYNSIYRGTPEILAKLDETVLKFNTSSISEEVFRAEVKDYFQFGGHPNGFYMTLLMKKVVGMEALIDSCNDIVSFLELYNQCALITPGEYVFSEQFIDFVAEEKNILK